jgi:hypothetical protein
MPNTISCSFCYFSLRATCYFPAICHVTNADWFVPCMKPTQYGACQKLARVITRLVRVVPTWQNIDFLGSQQVFLLYGFSVTVLYPRRDSTLVEILRGTRDSTLNPCPNSNTILISLHSHGLGMSRKV